MAYLNDSIDVITDESMIFMFDRLPDLTSLERFGCLTMAQCASLICFHSDIGKSAPTEVVGTYVMLACKDAASGELQILNPDTLLPWSEYLKMIKSGMYSDDNELQAPLPTLGWLVRLDECEKWYRSKGIEIDLSHVKQEISTIKNLIQRESQIHKEEFQGIASGQWKNNPNLTQAKIIDSDEMEFYRRNYRGKNTLRDWIREVDPRPKESRRGAPKKYPSI
ncbi:hypothetical protein W03_19640 [Nitrosomonas sp. PY1]|uniref:hypothetical protein n=1 Tax=Nitrosomonas sp. PY1 TaxID=1803906 RepID=UPI001FC82A98|nr:hypothetical protein [Nitrosomonas sp. PY1]GKS69960.1 hypothetical protein W03_19640 [Nitrosomonas sp. PY1]